MSRICWAIEMQKLTDIVMFQFWKISVETVSKNKVYTRYNRDYYVLKKGKINVRRFHLWILLEIWRQGSNDCFWKFSIIGLSAQTSLDWLIDGAFGWFIAFIIDWSWVIDHFTDLFAGAGMISGMHMNNGPPPPGFPGYSPQQLQPGQSPFDGSSGGGPPPGPQIQIRASAPNTIQYYPNPNRPPAPPKQARPPPNLDFLQPWTSSGGGGVGGGPPPTSPLNRGPPMMHQGPPGGMAFMHQQGPQSQQQPMYGGPNGGFPPPDMGPGGAPYGPGPGSHHHTQMMMGDGGGGPNTNPSYLVCISSKLHYSLWLVFLNRVLEWGWVGVLGVSGAAVCQQYVGFQPAWQSGVEPKSNDIFECAASSSSAADCSDSSRLIGWCEWQLLHFL